MKKIVLLFVFLLSVNVSYAVFSMHVRITPDVEQDNSLYIKVEPVLGDNKVKITLSPIGTTWLFVCAKPLSWNSQDFRDYVWYKKDEGKGIIEEKVLFSENDYREARKKLDQGKNDVITFFIEKEKLYRAYIYRDFPRPIHDGGFYYTVDLGAYASSMKSNYFEIAKNKIQEFGMDVDGIKCGYKSIDWKSLLNKKSSKTRLGDLYQKLTNKDFVAISCGPKDINMLGGTISVFIDRETDGIIDVLRGQ